MKLEEVCGGEMFLSVAKQSQHSIIKTSKNSVTLLVNKNLVTYSYPPILRVLSHVYQLLVTKKNLNHISDTGS